ncbi:hypothetical protein L13192_00322 [Pyrenophora tritici-repentis]|uniref:Uncharacterized protein n=1 Tax=Pyrenophora tritici-repentis TaxID=45151 RepID=A0A922NNT3_9PLEO|nr:hypothetical protein Ptr86124_003095 [Pyrenophora tritici-repentis]KAI1673575.1 hypothetical protein L13192_00322 [Pyrenophora tritici-repentis]KAI1689382.1 hypothetical protein KJE20_02560 [Pyrenophora tritici-repentis]
MEKSPTPWTNYRLWLLPIVQVDNDVDGEARGVRWSVSQNLGRAPVAAVMERCEVAAASSVWERR